MTRKILLLGAALASAVAVGAGFAAKVRAANGIDAPQAVQSGSCIGTRTSFVQSTTFQSGTATSFVPVAASLVNFTATGATSSCVIVSFSAVVSGTMVVRALLDNLPSFEGSVVLQLSSRSARTYNFVFPVVAPGAHSVFLEWRGNGNVISIEKFTVLVNHR